MTCKTIKKCKVKDIFYCIESLDIDTWVRYGDVIHHVTRISPSSSNSSMVLADVERLSEQGVMLLNYNENIELLKPIKEILSEL